MMQDLSPKPEKENRPKIQDIIPRNNRKSSLLAKIMGPRAPLEVSPLMGQSTTPLPERDAPRVFLRSLPFSRGGRAKPEKVIRLKKSVPPERVPAVSGEPREEKGRVVPSRRVSKTLEEARRKAEASAAVRVPSRSRLSFSPRLALLLGSVCAVVGIVLLSFVFARATVSLESSVSTLSLDGVRIEATDKVNEMDVAGKKIHAFLLEIPGSLKREFSASARERVSRRASGIVRIYNAFSSAPQTLVARTRLEDASGRIFRLKQRIVVPGAKIQNGAIVPSSVSAAVEAERAGGEFNIGPSRFTIPGFSGTPKFTGFYAESPEAFSGGFEGESFVVKQADIDAASEEVTAALVSFLKEDLERKIPVGATAIQGAREITITALRRPVAGAIQDRFTVEADGKAAVMLFRMDDLFSLLEQLALSPDAGKTLSQEKSRLEFVQISLSLRDHLLSFDIRGTLAAFSVLAPEEMQRALGGKTRAEAENILRADPRIRAFGIKLFPFWRNTIPADEGNIRVLVIE